MPLTSHGRLSTSQLVVASLICLCSWHRKHGGYAVVVPNSLAPSPLFVGIANITDNMPDEQRLFYTLMTAYEKSVRPTRKASDAVTVKLGLSLTLIMDLVSSVASEELVVT